MTPDEIARLRELATTTIGGAKLEVAEKIGTYSVRPVGSKSIFDDIMYGNKELCECIVAACNALPGLLDDYERMREALEIANDCLFGNTHGDTLLDEAYQTVHVALAKVQTHPREQPKGTEGSG